MLTVMLGSWGYGQLLRNRRPWNTYLKKTLHQGWLEFGALVHVIFTAPGWLGFGVLGHMISAAPGWLG